jgi:hypothetical protein
MVEADSVSLCQYFSIWLVKRLPKKSARK